MTDHHDGTLDTLLGHEVVIDVRGQYVYVGRLASYTDRFCVLENADVHDLRDTSTTRELYVLDSKRHGVRANRSRVVINRQEIVSLSRLADVIE